jgi:tetratricopeptide (TPR) repeat protein
VKTIDNHQEGSPAQEEVCKGKEEQEYEKEVTAIYLLLSRLYVKIKSYDSAITYYKKCLQSNPRKI